MTDVLHARFAALADTTDDSDWLDVRRRARRRRSVVVPVVAVAAAVVAAAAVAAGGGWLFSSHDQRMTATTHVRLGGHRWTVSLSYPTARWIAAASFCMRVSRPDTTPLRSGCGRASLLLGPFGASHVDVAGGQIWAGTAIGFTRRVSITDARGVVHTVTTVRAPRGTKTPFRYWAIAVDGTRAVSITAYDARGHSITRKLR